MSIDPPEKDTSAAQTADLGASALSQDDSVWASPSVGSVEDVYRQLLARAPESAMEPRMEAVEQAEDRAGTGRARRDGSEAGETGRVVGEAEQQEVVGVGGRIEDEAVIVAEDRVEPVEAQDTRARVGEEGGELRVVAARGIEAVEGVAAEKGGHG